MAVVVTNASVNVDLPDPGKPTNRTMNGLVKTTAGGEEMDDEGFCSIPANDDVVDDVDVDVDDDAVAAAFSVVPAVAGSVRGTGSRT